MNAPHMHGRRLQTNAERLYKDFHGRPTNGSWFKHHRRIIPPVLVHVGELAGLIYRSDKWTPGEMHSYIHMMKQPPNLAADPSGRQLYLLGGDYRITNRGIEG